jgi:hypothetical protein
MLPSSWPECVALSNIVSAMIFISHYILYCVVHQSGIVRLRTNSRGVFFLYCIVYDCFAVFQLILF